MMREQIEAFINVLFERAEKTEAVLAYRQLLLSQADLAFEEALNQGESVETAYGRAIQSLGDLTVVSDAIREKEAEKELTLGSDDLLNRYINHSFREGKRVGLCVALIILGVSVMISLTRFSWFDDYVALGLLPLFLAVVIAVSGFIYSGFKTEAIREEMKDYRWTTKQIETIKKELATKHHQFVTKTIIGVSLCILSPLILIGFASVNEAWAMTGTSLLLFFIAFAVYLFISVAKPKEALESLLKEKGVKKSEDKNEKEHQLAAIIWPLAVAVFLVTGFLYQLWYINWLIFPLTALIMTSIENAYRLFQK